MAIAVKSKPKSSYHKKRTALHHRRSKQYGKAYLPYLPMIAIVGAGMFINGTLNHPKAVLGAQSNLTQSALLQASNADRLQNQALPLTYDDQLQLAAQAKANDMAHKNYWSHVSPSGQQPWNFVTATGYQYQAAGENLAYGFTSARSVVGAWMASPTHRANLLNDNYSQVGFGVAQSADYLGHGPETIIVAMYALPTSAGSSIPVTTSAPDDTANVSRVQTYAGPAISGLLIGSIGTLAIVAVLLRHSFAWRRALNRSELFVIEHPVFDSLLVLVGVAAVILIHTVGVIH